jgi:HSP20 family protein
MLALWNTIPTFDRVFDDVMESAFSGFATTARFTPAVDIRSKDNEIVFSVDVPGVKREELDVTLEGGVLTIKGARKHEADQNDKMSLGRAYGEFTLSYVLPDSVDGEHLSAELAEGVLTVRVPKHPKAQPRKIEIGAGLADKQLTK